MGARSILRNTLTAFLLVAVCRQVYAGPVLAQSFPHHAPWDSQVVDSKTLRSGGATIQVDFGPGPLTLPRDRVLSWVQTCADTVSGYYGSFPVRSARILIQPAQANAAS